jgi:hypothetical protein
MSYFQNEELSYVDKNIKLNEFYRMWRTVRRAL